MNQSCFLRAEFITPGICFQSNYTILRLDIADNPSKPCLSCTKQWCLNQNLPICAGASLGDTDPDTATGKEGDVEARCFRERWILLFSIVPVNTVCIERDSPRDQLVVTLFLLTVFGLLLGAGIKHRMEKAGLDTSLPTWSSSRRWWEVCTSALNDFLTNSLFMQTWVPYGQYDNIGLGQRTYSRSRERNYVGLPGSPRWAMESSMMYTYIMSWFTGILGLTIEQLIPVPQVSSGFTHWASYALCILPRIFVASLSSQSKWRQLRLIVFRVWAFDLTPMGSLCSKSGSHSGGHTVSGSTSGSPGVLLDARPPPRTAAAQAAEARLKSVRARWPCFPCQTGLKIILFKSQQRGTNASNPNRGHLAAKVEAAKSAKRGPEPKPDERLVVSAILDQFPLI